MAAMLPTGRCGAGAAWVRRSRGSGVAGAAGTDSRAGALPVWPGPGWPGLAGPMQQGFVGIPLPCESPASTAGLGRPRRRGRGRARAPRPVQGAPPETRAAAFLERLRPRGVAIAVTVRWSHVLRQIGRRRAVSVPILFLAREPWAASSRPRCSHTVTAFARSTRCRARAPRGVGA